MANDNRNNQHREHILAATLAVLLGAVLLTSHAVSGAMAKYTTAGSSSDEARVALFGHSEKINFAGTWPNDIVPGTTTSLSLEITNKKGEKVSEVAQSYEIEIVTSGNLPLHYELHKSDGAGKTDTTVIDSFDESTNKSTYTFKVPVDVTTFEAGTSRTDYYQIRVSWPGSINSADYSNIPDFLQVNINVKQID